MRIRRRYVKPSIRRLASFALAFVIVKIIKPHLDAWRRQRRTAREPLSHNQQFVQIGVGEPFQIHSQQVTNSENKPPDQETILAQFQEEWNKLEQEAQSLERSLAEIPNDGPQSVSSQQKLAEAQNIKVPLGLPPALFLPPSQGGVAGLSLEQQQVQLAAQNAARAAQSSMQKPLGAPSPKNLQELYNDIEVNIRERELKIINRTVYIKEAIPRGFWNPEQSTLSSGQNRMTVLIFHDRDSKKDTLVDRQGFCCSDLWLSLGTLHRIAQEGHRAVAVDLPGYGHSLQSKSVDYIVYQFFLKLEQVLKLDNYIAIVPGMTQRLLVPYYFRRSQHIKALIMLSPPKLLSRSLQVITAAANVTLEVDTSDGNRPRGLDNFPVNTLIVYEEHDIEAKNIYDTWLQKLPKHEHVTLDITGSVDNVGVPEEKRLSYFYVIEPNLFHKAVIDFILRV